VAPHTAVPTHAKRRLLAPALAAHAARAKDAVHDRCHCMAGHLACWYQSSCMKLTSHMSAHAMCQWQLTQARRTDLMLARDARRTDVNIYIYIYIQQASLYDCRAKRAQQLVWHTGRTCRVDSKPAQSMTMSGLPPRAARSWLATCAHSHASFQLRFLTAYQPGSAYCARHAGAATAPNTQRAGAVTIDAEAAPHNLLLNPLREKREAGQARIPAQAPGSCTGGLCI